MAALGADPRQVFKTLVARVDGALTVAVVPVAGTLDLKALAAAAGGRKAVDGRPRRRRADDRLRAAAGSARWASEGAARPWSTSPRSASRRCMVSAGRRGLQVELPPADLVRLTRARTAPIGR